MAFSSRSPDFSGILMKYLLWLVVIGVVWWVWTKRQVAEKGAVAQPMREAEKMVCCAHCGVYLPESDAVAGEGRFYCSVAHQKQHLAADS